VLPPAIEAALRRRGLRFARSVRESKGRFNGSGVLSLTRDPYEIGLHIAAKKHKKRKTRCSVSTVKAWQNNSYPFCFFCVFCVFCGQSFILNSIGDNALILIPAARPFYICRATIRQNPDETGAAGSRQYYDKRAPAGTLEKT
jgi:hypothetical protein